MRRPARVARTEMGEHGPGRTRETYCRRYPCCGRASGKRRTGIWADSRLSDDHAPTPVHNPYPPCPYIPIPSQTHSNIRCHTLRGTFEDRSHRSSQISSHRTGSRLAPLPGTTPRCNDGLEATLSPRRLNSSSISLAKHPFSQLYPFT